jgi:hypothetical protein
MEGINNGFDRAASEPNDSYSFPPDILTYEQLLYAIKCTSSTCLDDMTKIFDLTLPCLRDVCNDRSSTTPYFGVS